MEKSTNHHKAANAAASGSNIRFEQPKSNRHRKKPKVTALVDTEVRAVNGFLEFLREHSVVSLAIAFVIGLQSQVLVKQLVSSFIDPLFKLLFGQALSMRTFTLHFNERAVNFSWGAFAYSLLDFLFVLAAIYAIVKLLKLDKLDKPKPKSKLAPHHKKEEEDDGLYAIDE
jgi:large conductance mechanosensitive channel protein